MSKKWMPKMAGIVDIIGGIIHWPFAFVGIFGGEVLVIVISVIIVPTSILAIVGGLRAIKRERWILALVASFFAFFPLAVWMCVVEARFEYAIFALPGLAAIIPTVLSKEQFK